MNAAIRTLTCPECGAALDEGTGGCYNHARSKIKCSWCGKWWPLSQLQEATR